MWLTVYYVVVKGKEELVGSVDRVGKMLQELEKKSQLQKESESEGEEVREKAQEWEQGS